MELQEFKELWKQYTSDEIERTNLDEQQIRHLLRGRTQNAISSINRNILIECGLLLIISVFFAMAAFSQPYIFHQIVMGFVLLICLVMGGYYVMKYIRVNSIAINPNNLKTSLEQLISVMQTFIRIYFYGSIILTPISFLSGFIYGYTKAGEPENFAHLTQLWFLGIAVLAAGFFTLLMYPFIKWYTHKLYGNYVDKLKICLRELTDEIAQ